jgi:hypothetical protein
MELFENRVLRNIFGTERQDVTSGWREIKMRNFKLYSHLRILLRS